MREQITQAIEDYLKAIYELTAVGERASTKQIAESLGVTPASVTGMVRKLAAAEPALLEYRKHHGVKLTPQGERIALETLRHHRLLEMYLHQVLGYGWDQVHGEADQLEHVISEHFENRIDQILGFPSHDPHGDPIPRANLSMPTSPSMPLSQAPAGQWVIIRRVGSEDPELLRYLTSLGLVPQAKVRVLEHTPIDFNLRLALDKGQDILTIGPAVSKQIFIEPIDAP